MIGNTTTPGSNKKSVALVLKDRLLSYESVQRRPLDQRRSFEQAWSDLQVLVPTKLSVNDAAAKLKVPFTASYDSEEDFDQALFNALKDCLNVLDSTDIDKDFMLLRRAGKKDADLDYGKEYAVGLARQKAVAHHLYPAGEKERVSELTENSASGLSYDSKPDHAVCLFEKDEHGSNTWAVKDCFAIMELKTSESTCSDFETDISDGCVQKPLLDSIHRSLGQALIYTLGGVLPFHARRGTLGTFLPVAVLACKKSPSTTSEGTKTKKHVPPKDSQSLETSEDRKPSATSGAALATMKSIDDSFSTKARSRATSDRAELIATSDRAELIRHAQTCQNDRRPSITKRVTMKQMKYRFKNPMNVTEVKIPKKPKSEGKLRWVSASIGIPEACGQKLTYSVHDYGNFHTNDADEQTSIEQAMVLYIDTFAFGLESALQVLRNFESNGLIKAPKPASGQFLYVGNKYLGWDLCASPIPGANAVRYVQGNHRWTVSQGELFTGTLNIPEVLAQSNSHGDFLNFLDGTHHALQNAKVLIKVSSRAVHFHLVDPFSAHLALERIKTATDLVRLNPDLDPGLRHERLLLRQEVSSVLYAAAKTEAGMVTIMADLSQKGYGILSPQNHAGSLSTLWEGFRNLVANVLLPMAKLKFIHTDIRPGFDETANILCKVEGTGASERAILKLIDYDSVVGISDWEAPTNGSYIEKVSKKWTATTFVWWQCLAVAYAWMTGTPGIVFFSNKKISLVKHLRKEVKESFPELEQYVWEDAISEAVVMQTLDIIAADFRKQD